MLRSHSLWFCQGLLLLFFITLAASRQYSSNINIPTFRRHDAWTFIDRIHLYPGHITVNAEIKLLTTKYKEGSMYEL